MVRAARVVVCLLLLLLVASPLGNLGQHAGLAAAAKPPPPDTTPPVANAGPNQTVPQGTLVTFNGTGSYDNVGVVNYTWAVPDVPGPLITHFSTTFGTLYALDPVRPVLYEANATMLAFVDLTTGAVIRSFRLNHLPTWPMSMAVSPKGNYLAVGIPTDNRSDVNFGPYSSYLAGFNLVTGTELAESLVGYDIFDVAATDDGYAVLSGGSGQWTPLEVVNLTTGAAVGSTSFVWENSPIAMHPGGTRVYSVDGPGISPAAVYRFDFTTTGGVSSNLAWPYWGPDPGSDLWVGADRIVTSNGRLLVSQVNATGDMAQIAQLPAGFVAKAAFDPLLGLIAVSDGSLLEFYDYDSGALLGSVGMSAWADAFAFRGDQLEIVEGGQYATVAVPKTFLFGPTPSYRFMNAGSFVVRLTVYDAAGNSGNATVTITVRDTTPPVAVAGPDQSVMHGTPVTLNGNGSTDNVGIAAYWWTFNDGGPVNLSGAIVQWRFNATGTYLVTLHVMDAAGNQATATTNVTVTRDTQPPFAYAWPGGIIFTGMSWTFNANGSSDNVGIASYAWTFTDNGTPVTLSGPQPSYTFLNAGDFTVILTVADFDGNTATATTTVHVVPVALTPYEHGTNHFRIGFPTGWPVQPDAQIGSTGTVDLLSSGSSLQASPATIFVLSGNESVQETDTYLLSQAAYAIQEVQRNDPTAAVVDSPHVIATANTRAAVVAFSLQYGSVYQMWGIAVNVTYGRMWVIVGTARMTDNATYRVAFTAVIASFAVLAPPAPPAPGSAQWLSQNGYAVAVLGTLLGAGVAAGVAWVVGRLRRKPATPPNPRPRY